MVKNAVLAACLLVMGASFMVTPAYAYLDPGTGSMLLQGLIGGIAAAGAVASLYFHKFKAMISGRRGGDKEATAAHAPEDESR